MPAIFVKSKKMHDEAAPIEASLVNSYQKPNMVSTTPEIVAPHSPHNNPHRLALSLVDDGAG